MAYAAEHASALADIGDAGAVVTFTLSTPGTYDATTDTWTTPVTSTVAGSAIRTRGNPLKYQSLGLVQSESPSLLFAPSTYGATPALNSSVTWNSIVYRVKDVEPVAPDGTAIIHKIVVAR